MNQIAPAGQFGQAPYRADTRAELAFIVPSGSKPVFHSSATTGGAPRVFFDVERQSVPIRDMRALSPAPALDREGFALLGNRTQVSDLYDDDAVARDYHPEIEALLKAETGASRVVIFDTTRRADGPVGAANRDGLRGPADRVHVDYTVNSGPKRAADLLGEGEFERLTTAGARIVQINVWRPIRGPVQRSPLAVADAASIRPIDLIATDQVFPDRVGEIYHLAYHPGQRWYYAPEMTPDEVLLIKGWDSREDGRARFAPHGAFALPDMPEDAPPRESIEVRTYVVLDR